MRFNLCSSCVNFQPELRLRTQRVPKSCNCPKLKDFFGADVHGFPSGIDVMHCDYFQQYPSFYGDVFITEDKIHGVSYIDTRVRKSNENRVIVLTNNAKNLRYVQNKT